jgi:hypothetical protein
MPYLTVADVRARCITVPGSRCWLWQGPTVRGMPRLHAVDHARGEKRTMVGTLAMWNIAHGQAPKPGCLVFRRCWRPACLNPDHLRQASSKAELFALMAADGVRKGTHIEARRRNVMAAWAATGLQPTDESIVLAIRRAPPNVTASALALEHGIAVQTASRIRRGESHRHLLPTGVKP